MKSERAPKQISFTVPLVPPSVNHYRRRTLSRDAKGRAGSYETGESKSFKSAVAHFAPHADQWGGFDSPAFSVALHVYLGAGRKGDVDNFAKVCLDSLVAARLIRTDARVTSLHIQKSRDRINPRTEFTIKEV